MFYTQLFLQPQPVSHGQKKLSRLKELYLRPQRVRRRQQSLRKL